MSAIDLLIDAKELIADRESWCQHVDALDADGAPAMDTGRAPVAFCALGALSHAADLADAALIVKATACLAEVIGTPNIADWNDSHTHHEVIDAFDEAIARRKAVTAAP